MVWILILDFNYIFYDKEAKGCPKLRTALCRPVETLFEIMNIV